MFYSIFYSIDFGISKVGAFQQHGELYVGGLKHFRPHKDIKHFLSKFIFIFLDNLLRSHKFSQRRYHLINPVQMVVGVFVGIIVPRKSLFPDRNFQRG